MKARILAALLMLIPATVLMAEGALADGRLASSEGDIGAFSFPGFRLCSSDAILASETADTTEEKAEGEEAEFQDDSGNDPRDFRNKFMPYYLDEPFMALSCMRSQHSNVLVSAVHESSLMNFPIFS